ncbi:hypothetical protein [Streptomyces sp. ME19-01-6]|uniref:hypothetical protein n=1 Tax=Streptomyces sp. ME19-01-6 TaxID=3028686 RepID=UPI0029BD3490|nr:hypothetical protein [Streptomyces sp. ME19-01-6]MDX3232865.1 hypothetical protein [Streptomyces sp. ME19-01-6]
MNLIAARSIALADAVEAVNRLHSSVLDTGSGSPETDEAAGKATEAVAQAADFGITTTDIGLASRT